MVDATAVWNEEYAADRYLGEPPVPFVEDIVAAAHQAGVADRLGLYIGCGNGRNYLPLLARGLDLVGLDVSQVAIEQLLARTPRPDRLVCGDLAALSTRQRFAMVLGIQVFQHGDRTQARDHIRAAVARVEPGGLFALRVNADETEIEFDHDVVERGPGRGMTITYRDGPKAGLQIHFFDRTDLEGSVGPGFEAILPPRLATMVRTPPSRGRWSQWEAIWRRAAEPRTLLGDPRWSTPA